MNCGAIAEHLIESEVFGHKRGAFTGAVSDNAGLIHESEGGTLFLDEVDSLTCRAQAKLLRFLQDGEYRPVGSQKVVHANVRIVAAANADFKTIVKERKFREDLFYRLNVLDIALEYNTYTPDQGWGRGWHTIGTEVTTVKNQPSQRSWAILDKQSGRGYHLIPGPNDGAADAFSSRDLWVLRYHGSEDRYGAQGSASSDDLQPYLNGESTDGQDIVLWYCGHLSHQAAHGGDEWHHTGPNLVPFRNWD